MLRSLFMTVGLIGCATVGEISQGSLHVINIHCLLASLEMLYNKGPDYFSSVNRTLSTGRTIF